MSHNYYNWLDFLRKILKALVHFIGRSLTEAFEDAAKSFCISVMAADADKKSVQQQSQIPSPGHGTLDLE